MLGFVTAEAALLPYLLSSAVSVAIFSVWPPLSMPARTPYVKAILQVHRKMFPRATTR